MDYEEYLELRRKQIESKDFAEICRKALEGHRGEEVPVVDQIKKFLGSVSD